jgi:hypothetical protein
VDDDDDDDVEEEEGEDEVLLKKSWTTPTVEPKEKVEGMKDSRLDVA